MRNIAIVNDNEEDVKDIISIGQRLNNTIKLITPSNYIDSAIQYADLIIIVKIKTFPYHNIRLILHEITERRLPYFSIEFDSEKLNYAYTNWSFFNRAIAVFMSDNDLLKKFMSNNVNGVLYRDNYELWRFINIRLKDGKF